MLKEVSKYVHVISCHLKPLLVLSVDSLLLTPIVNHTKVPSADLQWVVVYENDSVERFEEEKVCSTLVLWVSVSDVSVCLISRPICPVIKLHKVQ